MKCLSNSLKKKYHCLKIFYYTWGSISALSTLWSYIYHTYFLWVTDVTRFTPMLQFTVSSWDHTLPTTSLVLIIFVYIKASMCFCVMFWIDTSWFTYTLEDNFTNFVSLFGGLRSKLYFSVTELSWASLTAINHTISGDHTAIPNTAVDNRVPNDHCHLEVGKCLFLSNPGQS